MRRFFFILGLPRSRTAWLANLFTHGDISLCHHDLSRRCANGPAELLQRMLLTPGAAYVGDSDNGLALQIQPFLASIGSAPVALVERRPEDVLASLMALSEDADRGQAERVVDICSEALQTASRHPTARSWSYEDLDSLDALQEMWEHLMPTVAFPAERVRQMQYLNVQWHVPAYMATMNPEYARRAKLAIEVP